MMQRNGCLVVSSACRRALRGRQFSVVSPSDDSTEQTLPHVKVFHVPGLTPYQVAWNWQQCIHRELVNDATKPGALLLLEHTPVYTLGRGSSTDNILFDFNDNTDHPFDLHRVERGGEVTYHGPRQLVGYPILNLKQPGFRKDLHWYLRQIEEVLIETLAEYKLTAQRVEEHTGVWVGNRKLAAIGLSCSKWVTMHGFALNIDPDLSAFDLIVPCGISKTETGRTVGSLAGECRKEGIIPPNGDIKGDMVRHIVCKKFEKVFGVTTETLVTNSPVISVTQNM